jgi:NAD-dependent DNA ligase
MKPNLKLPVAQLKILYRRAKDAYYNDKPIMSDADFDRLEDYLKEQVPNWSGFKAGAPVKNKKTKAQLPVPIFSLDKIKKPEQVANWLEHSPDEVVIMDKLDGAALELVYEGVPIKLYTRGNGKIGGDVSYLIPHLRGIPKKLSTKKRVIVRCEGIFTKAAFQKYTKDFDAARNAASGILNRTDVHHSLKDLQVVALQLLDPNPPKFSAGLKFLERSGFRVVSYRVVKSAELTFNRLAQLLQKRKTNSQFECDGLVLVQNKKLVLPKSGNPDWGVAFKETVEIEDAPTARVVKMHWKVSPHGYLIPRVEIEPTKLSGATIRFAAAKNAKLMMSMGIGPGAVVRLVRSGDIIPDIIGVDKKVKAKLPDPDVIGNYHWDKNGVNIVLDDPKASAEFRVQRIARTFLKLDVDFLRGKTIQRLMDIGLDSVTKILRASAKDFESVPGFKKTSADKLYRAIHEKTDAGFTLPQLMNASSMFPRGVGETQLTALSEQLNLMQLAKQSPKVIVREVMGLPGFQRTNAEKIAQGLPKFVKWLRITGLKVVKPKSVKLSSKKMMGINVSWTGYRDKDQEQAVIKNGGSVVSWSPKRTTVLLFRPGGKSSGKIDIAKQQGIPTMTWEQFSRKYKL